MAETPALALFAKQRNEIQALLSSPASPEAEKTIKVDVPKEANPEHLIVLAHGLDGTPRDLAYVKRALDGGFSSIFDDRLGGESTVGGCSAASNTLKAV
jgi:hypothetical protein